MSRQLPQRRCRKHGVTKLKCLGGFKNNRKVYEWKGETIELDETMYDWGTCYEIELETVRLSSASRMTQSHTIRRVRVWVT